MKYLKEYIGYNEYYQEVNHNDYEEIIFLNKNVPFEVSEIRDLINMFSDKKYEVYNNDNISLIMSWKPSTLNYLEDPRFKNDMYKMDVIADDYDITIRSLGDEWYLVSVWGDDYMDNKFYRCDQIGGIKKLIEDKL